MTAILDQLHQDHVNVAHLLDFLEDELSTPDEGRMLRIQLMRDVMHYMTRYPDLFHHPKEDVVFRQLLLRDTAATPLIEHLMLEHQVLAEKGDRLLATLDAAVAGSIFPRSVLQTLIEDYVVSLRNHMDKEENQIFPLALALLTDNDWEKIAASVASQSDPLFGKVVEDGFASLKREILVEKA